MKAGPIDNLHLTSYHSHQTFLHTVFLNCVSRPRSTAELSPLYVCGLSGRIDKQSFIRLINYHTGFGSLRFTHIANFRIIYRYQGRILGFTVLRRQYGSLRHRGLRRLFPIGHQHCMGPRDVLGMKPNIIIVGCFQGKPVILPVIAAN